MKSPARLLEMQRWGMHFNSTLLLPHILVGTTGCDNACSREVRAKILSYRSIYDRNNAASKALMLFYGLAEIDQQLVLITKANRELRKNEKRVDALRKEDLEIPFDATELVRSRVELNNKREELELKQTQATKQLLVLINDACTRDHLTPQIDGDISKISIDVDATVQEAMSLRADLGLLQMLNNCLNDHTLSATNQALKLTSAALGYAECPPTLRDLLRLACRGPEPVDQNQVASRRDQIQALERDLRRQIDSEVRSAASEIETDCDKSPWLGKPLTHGTSVSTIFMCCDNWRKRLHLKSPTPHCNASPPKAN